MGSVEAPTVDVRERLDAGRRIDVEAALAAFVLFSQDPVDVQVADFVVDLDVVVVERAGIGRSATRPKPKPNESAVIDFRSRIAAAAALDVAVGESAVAEILPGLLATEVIVDGREEAAFAGEHVCHVRRAEGGGEVAADQ